MVVGTKWVPQHIYVHAMFGSVCQLLSLYYSLPVSRSSHENITDAGASNFCQQLHQWQGEKQNWVQIHSELNVTSDGTDLNLSRSQPKELIVHRKFEMAVEYGGSPDNDEYKLKDGDEKQETRNMSEVLNVTFQMCDVKKEERVCENFANCVWNRPMRAKVDAYLFVQFLCAKAFDIKRTLHLKLQPETLLTLKLPVAAIPADPEVSELDEPLCELCTIANDDVDFWEGKHVKPVVDISISKNSVVDKTVSQLLDLKHHDEISEKTEIPVSLILINEKSEWREWYPKRRRKGGARSSFRENVQSSDDTDSHDTENDETESVEIYTEENENTSNIGLQAHGAPECFDVMNSEILKLRSSVLIETLESRKGAKKLQIKFDKDSKRVIKKLSRQSPRVNAQSVLILKFKSLHQAKNEIISPLTDKKLNWISVVDVKNDNVQKTRYTEHESICKSTHGSIVKVLSEGNPLE